MKSDPSADPSSGDDPSSSSGIPSLWWVHGDKEENQVDELPIGSCVNSDLLLVLRTTLKSTYAAEPQRPKREVRKACQNRADELAVRERELRERGTLTESQILTQLVSLAASQLPECEDCIAAQAASQPRTYTLQLLQQKLDECQQGSQDSNAKTDGVPKVTHNRGKYSGYDDVRKVDMMFEANIPKERIVVAPDTETQQHVKEAVHQRMKQLWKSKLTIASAGKIKEEVVATQTNTDTGPRQMALDACGGLPIDGIGEWQFESSASTEHRRRLAALNEALFATKLGVRSSPFCSVPRPSYNEL